MLILMAGLECCSTCLIAYTFMASTLTLISLLRIVSSLDD